MMFPMGRMGDYQFNRPTLDDRSDLVALKELVGGGGASFENAMTFQSLSAR
jgi:hypothetical protein